MLCTTHVVPLSIDEAQVARHMLTLTRPDSQHLPFTTFPSEYENNTDTRKKVLHEFCFLFVFFIYNIVI